MTKSTLTHEHQSLATGHLEKAELVSRLQLVAGEAWGTEYATSGSMPFEAASALAIPLAYYDRVVKAAELPSNLGRQWGELIEFTDEVVLRAATKEYDWAERASAIERLHRLVAEDEIDPKSMRDVGSIMGWAARLTTVSMDQVPGDTEYYGRLAEYSLDLLDAQLRLRVPASVMS